MSMAPLVDPAIRAVLGRAGSHWSIESRWTAAILALALLLGGLVAILAPTAVGVLLAPLAGLILLIFWVMPAPKSVPFNAGWVLLVAAIAVTAVWPAYVALRLPGMPWIGLSRLLCGIYLVVWLYCVLNSQEMRAELTKDYRVNRPLFLFVGGWMATMFAGIAVSGDPSETAMRTVNYQLANTAILLGVICFANTPQRVLLLAKIIVCCGVFEMANGLVEAHVQRPIWLDVVPPGFSTDEEFVRGLLEGVWREGEYRVQGSFFISLSYAEFIVLTLPFAYYFMLTARKLLWKAVCAGIILISFPAIYVAHSRLGLVGFFTVGLVYGAFYALYSWRNSKKSVFGPILVILFPLLLAAFVGSLAMSNRLQNAMIGTGATEASDEARVVQRQLAYPKIAARPIIGYGMAQGAPTVGYANAGGDGTFDNYIFLVALDNGLVGLFCFLGFVIWVIIIGARVYLTGQSKLSGLAAAISTCFIAFLIIKWVLAQQENHQLIMAVAGMLVAIRRMELAASTTEPKISPNSSRA